MPLFLLNARDKPGALDVRMSNRPAHLDWAKAHADRILMAGPVFADDGETFAGSTFVVEFDSLRDAEAWAAQDPYAKAGLFASVEIMPFKWLLGEGKPSA
ncbi:YciI family protein [Henriciella mobilis]|uniref:YciI family protein n=1 Tax=Henriciella mobilis TaxID=2305467 RepID=UPI000E66B801|nr:YciI family protein [Henriciella mobilis]RIJ18030.1 YciI family protein [Henriciella mobilis]RIJ25161.1 YciI family protein [Henriciella mobilis]